MAKFLALEVCLYGARHCGYGYLAVAPIESVLPGKGRPVGLGARLAMFGTGEPGTYSSMTEALYAAQAELLEGVGRVKGVITVFAPGGETCAEVVLGSCQNIGSLEWKAAPVYTMEVK